MALEQDTGAAEPVGRRERKKQATRQALADAAMRLFASRGFDATTVEDIADAVDVAPRTFYRYFARKEDAVFADHDRRLTGLRAALAERPRDEALTTSIRVAVVAVLGELDGEPDRRRLEALRTRVVVSSPALRAHNLRYQDEWAQLVAEHVAERSGCSADDPWPVLVGRTTLSVLVVARRLWAADPATDLDACMADAFALLARFADDADDRVTAGVVTR